MRKLIVSMNVTLDGFMAGPDAELDWHFQSWSSDMAQSLSEELGKADTIVLGRVTYDAMATYWQRQSACLSIARDDIAFADMMNNYKKVVFSKTLTRTHWKNSKVINGKLSSTILQMKQESGKDMIIYGSGKLVATLMQKNLVDEFILWIHPILIGEGKSFFNLAADRLKLRLIERHSFSSGVVSLRYQICSPIHYPTTNDKR